MLNQALAFYHSNECEVNYEFSSLARGKELCSEFAALCEVSSFQMNVPHVLVFSSCMLIIFSRCKRDSLPISRVFPLHAEFQSERSSCLSLPGLSAPCAPWTSSSSAGVPHLSASPITQSAVLGPFGIADPHCLAARFFKINFYLVCVTLRCLFRQESLLARALQRRRTICMCVCLL